MGVSMRKLKRRSRERGPSRHYTALKGARWTLAEDRLWKDKRARQRQFFEDAAAGRVKSGSWFSGDLAKRVKLVDSPL
jgi:hypothetical protein